MEPKENKAENSTQSLLERTIELVRQLESLTEPYTRAEYPSETVRDEADEKPVDRTIRNINDRLGSLVDRL